jgi:hypothetical protein
MDLARPAVDKDGDVFVAGLFKGSLTRSGTKLGDSTPGRFDTFVVKLDASGELAWSKILLVASPSVSSPPVKLAAWPSGQVAVISDGVVSSFDSAGNKLWKRPVESIWTTSAAVDSAGRLKIVLSSSESTTSILSFGSNGDVLPKTEIASHYVDDPRLSFDPSGRTLIGGVLSGPEDVVGATRLDPQGDPVWSRSFTGPTGAPHRYSAVTAFGPSGSAWIAGTFVGQLDLGEGVLTSQGPADVFVAQLPP